MKNLKLDEKDLRSLSKRYLFWLFKMTRDEIDKVERKFTQLDIDRDVEKILKKRSAVFPQTVRRALEPYLKEWKEYIFQKASDAQKLKYKEDGSLEPQYLFLLLKLTSVCEVVRRRFGAKELARFKDLYEAAALKRILEDTSAKR